MLLNWFTAFDAKTLLAAFTMFLSIPAVLVACIEFYENRYLRRKLNHLSEISAALKKKNNGVENTYSVAIEEAIHEEVFRLLFRRTGDRQLRDEFLKLYSTKHLSLNEMRSLSPYLTFNKNHNLYVKIGIVNGITFWYMVIVVVWVSILWIPVMAHLLSSGSLVSVFKGLVFIALYFAALGVLRGPIRSIMQAHKYREKLTSAYAELRSNVDNNQTSL